MASINSSVPSDSAAQTTVAIQSARDAASDGIHTVWVLTGYGIFGLCMLGLIAYSFAQYAAR